MMTSVIGRRRSNHRGYTLLEICFALFIIAIMTGATLPSLTSWLTEERLRAPARALSEMARTARLLALETRQPQTIMLQADQFYLLTGEAPSATPPYEMPEEILFSARRWDQSKLTPITEMSWVFQPSGLCEPLHVKFQRDRAELELEFDPLTATIAEERYVFP
jgi:type II secretory pathway pseudopilin PulG